ncbi:MAG: arsenic efflux protein, partial [Lachnospiraceae bacterium]|nr:arsenic efflux protein [Lachnospiraceae bacterium]
MWETILDAVLDALLDTAKILPFLFLTYLLMEWLEHRTEDKTKKAVEKAGHLGPLFGGLLGVIPQCGFSAAAASLYSGRVVTVGTLLAVFISTSDEMIPIMLGELASGKSDWTVIVKAVAAKLVFGIAIGFLVDFLHRFMMLRGWIKPKHMLPATADKKKLDEEPGTEHIKDLCEQEKCKCETGIFKSAVKHTLQVIIYILAISLVLNLVIEFGGEEVIKNLLIDKPILGALLAGIIGLIPNCAASVAITELYMEGAIGAGALL